ncbi:MAG: GNAT family N-acetyltransferase [Proteobacteria bacterium]|nr:GNAT family N-acetyltransferase [Pseudomonadota bacterium]
MLNQLAFTNNNKITGVSFETISENDMAFLIGLYKSTRWDEVMQAPWDDIQRHEFLKQQFQAQHEYYQSHYSHSEFLLILKNNNPIGRVYLDREDNSICLIDIALMPKFKSQGLGTKLLKELLKEAQLTNKKIVIHVENFNPAYQWYLKHGFKQVEDKGVYQYMEWHPTIENEYSKSNSNI